MGSIFRDAFAGPQRAGGGWAGRRARAKKRGRLAPRNKQKMRHEFCGCQHAARLPRVFAGSMTSKSYAK